MESLHLLHHVPCPRAIVDLEEGHNLRAVPWALLLLHCSCVDRPRLSHPACAVQGAARAPSWKGSDWERSKIGPK